MRDPVIIPSSSLQVPQQEKQAKDQRLPSPANTQSSSSEILLRGGKQSIRAVGSKAFPKRADFIVNKVWGNESRKVLSNIMGILVVNN